MGIMTDEEEYAKELAEEHWQYVQLICKIMYITAFVHGYKHAEEDTEDN